MMSTSLANSSSASTSAYSAQVAFVERRRIRIRRKHLASQAQPRRCHCQHPAQLSAAENSDGVAGLQLHRI